MRFTGAVSVGLYAGVLAAAVGCAPAPSGSPTPATVTLAAGVYTAAQAARGEQTFARSCATCHGPREFAGRLFEIRWSGQSVGELFRLISSTMPFDRPGALPPQEYADLIAYLLQLNGHPAGQHDLAPDQIHLDALHFD